MSLLRCPLFENLRCNSSQSTKMSPLSQKYNLKIKYNIQYWGVIQLGWFQWCVNNKKVCFFFHKYLYLHEAINFNNLTIPNYLHPAIWLIWLSKITFNWLSSNFYCPCIPKLVNNASIIIDRLTHAVILLNGYFITMF